jgi:tetratricopeptide (TPR) repeat protein
MMIEKWNREIRPLALFSFLALLSACGGSFQTGGDIAQGRQAMFRGDYQGALGYFQRAEQTDPNYIYGTELREGVLSYLGRAQYLTGDLAQARQTLNQSLAKHKGDNLARLYLGMTLARQDDRKGGLQQMEAGMKGIAAFLNYITSAFATGFGQFWDPGQTIRKAVANNLAIIARGNFDWPTVIANGESIAMNMEQEPDRANQQQEQQLQMDMPR